MEQVLGYLVSTLALAVILIGFPSQILKNYKEKRFGMSILLVALGCLLLVSRIGYTILRKDYFILVPDFISLLVHVVLLYQILLYRKNI